MVSHAINTFPANAYIILFSYRFIEINYLSTHKKITKAFLTNSISYSWKLMSFIFCIWWIYIVGHKLSCIYFHKTITVRLESEFFLLVPCKTQDYSNLFYKYFARIFLFQFWTTLYEIVPLSLVEADVRKDQRFIKRAAGRRIQ